jgi:hypothetical protein
MSFTIVYKTYLNDIQWLKYSLLSINKFVKDISEIIIYYHDICYEQLLIMLNNINIKFNIRLIPVNYDIHGYLKQMVVKCMAFKDVKTDYIVFIDSDVIFKMEYTPKVHFIDEKINWYILKRDSNNNNESLWAVWEESVKKMTNQNMDIFYMYNGFPFIIKRKTLEDAYIKFLELHNMDYHVFCKFYLDKYQILPSMPIIGPNGKFMEMAKIFEEFEYMGWYSKNYTNDYNFIESPSINSKYSIQYWSHGGLTSNIEENINIILNNT